MELYCRGNIIDIVKS